MRNLLKTDEQLKLEKLIDDLESFRGIMKKKCRQYNLEYDNAIMTQSTSDITFTKYLQEEINMIVSNAKRLEKEIKEVKMLMMKNGGDKNKLQIIYDNVKKRFSEIKDSMEKNKQEKEKNMDIWSDNND